MPAGWQRPRPTLSLDVERQSMAAKTQSDLSRPPGGRHAFIVDDEPQVRAFVSKALVGAGFIPHEFSRVPEVEAALTLFKPEVIVLDLSLGGTDAVEMMRSLAASRFAGKILLVSGHDPATLDEVRKIGERRGLAMLPILRKPFRLEELRARLADVTEPTGVAAGGSDLEVALQNNWLELWYQPKIDLKSMAVCGAEALIRLRHPKHGIIQPAAFLPPPGDPLYQPLTDFVVRRSLADWSTFAAWPSNRRRMDDKPTGDQRTGVDSAKCGFCQQRAQTPASASAVSGADR